MARSASQRFGIWIMAAEYKLYRLKSLIMKKISNIRILSFLDNVYRIVSLPFAFFAYVITTRVLRRPYFGVWMGSGQGNPLRYPMMRRAVTKSATDSNARSENAIFRVMEIGAYAGGSAIEFASALKQADIGQFLVFSVDPWNSYLDVSRNKAIQYRIMNYNLGNGNALRLFIRNVRAAGISEVCRQLRGKAEEILPMLKEHQFGFIYIDGDHAPEAVLKDLQESARLLAPGGYLSGDDLEVQMADADGDFVRDHADRDIAMDEASGKIFHPGVTLAVGEFFGRKISCYDGFWVVRWNGESFEDVDLTE
jgi:predicted O-methyltransferase YrrM